MTDQELLCPDCGEEMEEEQDNQWDCLYSCVNPECPNEHIYNEEGEERE